MTAPAPHGSSRARIGILDRNRSILGRVARIVGAAAGLAPVASDTDPAGLREQLSPEAQLLMCSADDLELALEWASTRFLRAAVVVWGQGPMGRTIEIAQRSTRVHSVLGWPSYQSMPRPWELAFAVRRVLGRRPTQLAVRELFAGDPVITRSRPRASEDRDRAVAELGELAARAGAPDRLVSRITEVGHELVMNAMYDAPVDHYGEPRYASDRRAAITLDDHEVPTVTFATDGSLIALQVSDPFGRLARDHVFEGIGRGLAAADGGDRVIDDSNGGAGLGLWRIYATSAITVFDVIVGHATTVTAVFDLDVNPREARRMPSSLHVFADDPSTL